METKYKWKSDPWQRKEPGSRMSQKQKFSQVRSERERAQMENKQHVKVIFHRNWIFGLPDMLNKFQIEMKVPISHQEIMERMQKAFPNLILSLEERG